MQAVDKIQELVVKYKFSAEDISTLQENIAALVPLQALEAATGELVDAINHCYDPAVETFIVEARDTIDTAESETFSAVQEMYNQMFNAHLLIQAGTNGHK